MYVPSCLSNSEEDRNILKKYFLLLFRQKKEKRLNKFSDDTHKPKKSQLIAGRVRTKQQLACVIDDQSSNVIYTIPFSLSYFVLKKLNSPKILSIY
jgi:hypothetical protein